jgi:hypothetical protein
MTGYYTENQMKLAEMLCELQSYKERERLLRQALDVWHQQDDDVWAKGWQDEFSRLMAGVRDFPLLAEQKAVNADVQQLRTLADRWRALSLNDGYHDTERDSGAEEQAERCADELCWALDEMFTAPQDTEQKRVDGGDAWAAVLVQNAQLKTELNALRAAVDPERVAVIADLQAQRQAAEIESAKEREQCKAAEAEVNRLRALFGAFRLECCDDWTCAQDHARKAGAVIGELRAEVSRLCEERDHLKAEVDRLRMWRVLPGVSAEPDTLEKCHALIRSLDVEICGAVQDYLNVKTRAISAENDRDRLTQQVSDLTDQLHSMQEQARK